jgi:hypothetical protein
MWNIVYVFEKWDYIQSHCHYHLSFGFIQLRKIGCPSLLRCIALNCQMECCVCQFQVVRPSQIPAKIVQIVTQMSVLIPNCLDPDTYIFQILAWNCLDSACTLTPQSQNFVRSMTQTFRLVFGGPQWHCHVNGLKDKVNGQFSLNILIFYMTLTCIVLVSLPWSSRSLVYFMWNKTL